ncbi:MAG TPA: carboxypeptidase-like regulatory domain-containing protein, partial [Solirubrobacterales bacterium]|nr:carboxypeptidase-like regulatory domain-containing protein [Solirubrobacterales bacterium]
MEKLRIAIVSVAALLSLAALTPAAAVAGSISGTVTGEGGGAIQGAEVCPRSVPYYVETTCVETDAEGHYSAAGLPPSDYRIGFSVSRGNLKWVDEYYDDKLHYSEADLFHLNEGEAATVDAELAEGGSISGTVVDETNDQPIVGLWACAVDEEGGTPRCAPSDATGEYLING